MGTLIARRLAFMVFVLWGITLVTFFLSRVVPGDPARLLAGPQASPAEVAHLARIYGKLGVGSRLAAIRLAAQSGLVTVGATE